MESSNSPIEQGMKHYVIEAFKSAEQCFSEAIKLSPTYDAYLYRSQCYIKLKKYDEALNDLLEADKIKNAESYGVCFRRGIVYFYLEKYVESDKCFKSASKLSSTIDSSLSNWIEKVKCEVTEAKPTTDKGIEFKAWKQDSKTIYISFTNNTGFDFNALTITFLPRQFTICKDKDTLINIELCNSIVPEKSLYLVSGDQIDFTLIKSVADFNWQHFDQARMVVSSTQPLYPSSAQTKKDWNKVDQILAEEQYKDLKEEEGTMYLFKEIFSRGDEATRRAMMKSFQTSGGTVLSTNWNEVQEKDYEGKDRPSAPDGQEWKSYKDK